MRKITFTADKQSEDRFEILYEGALNTPRGYKAPKETRLIGKVLDKLEAVGTPFKDNNRATYKLLFSKAGDVLLEDEEYSLLKEALDEIKWTGTISRKAADALEFLEASPSVKVEETKWPVDAATLRGAAK